MKQFSLNEYLANPSRKVVTRDGHSVRIICTDANRFFPIVALIEEMVKKVYFAIYQMEYILKVNKIAAIYSSH